MFPDWDHPGLGFGDGRPSGGVDVGESKGGGVLLDFLRREDPVVAADLVARRAGEPFEEGRVIGVEVGSDLGVGVFGEHPSIQSVRSGVQTAAPSVMDRVHPPAMAWAAHSGQRSFVVP